MATTTPGHPVGPKKAAAEKKPARPAPARPAPLKNPYVPDSGPAGPLVSKNPELKTLPVVDRGPASPAPGKPGLRQARPPRDAGLRELEAADNELRGIIAPSRPGNSLSRPDAGHDRLSAIDLSVDAGPAEVDPPGNRFKKFDFSRVPGPGEAGRVRKHVDVRREARPRQSLGASFLGRPTPRQRREERKTSHDFK
jgi:hypothetical protein